MRINKAIILYFLFIIISVSCDGSNFRHSSGLPVPDTSGFYKIQIPPPISSKLNNDFSDLRIVDADNKEIPFILKSDNLEENNNVFKEYEITGRKFYADSLTSIIFRNNSGKNINEISLVIRNAEVHKVLKLLGSFNGRQWYVVKDEENISSISNSSSVAEVRIINFPMTNYTFYKIEINDKESPPLDIIKVGYYYEQKTKPSLNELPASFTVADSSVKKSTWLFLNLDEAAVVDEIEFEISAPQYFNRLVEIFHANANKNNVNGGLIKEFRLNSREELKINLPGLKLKNIRIEIHNGDNPSLTIRSLNVYQYNHYIIAQLVKGKKYNLLFGDTFAAIPQYDLQYFESVIPSTLPVLVPGKIENTALQTAVTAEKNFFTDRRFIWIALMVVISLMGLLTYRMINEKK